MTEPYDPVQLFKECCDTLRFFESQLTSSRWQLRRFREDVVTAEQAGSLRKLQAYLVQKSLPNSSVNDSIDVEAISVFMKDDAPGRLTAARREEQRVLHEMTKILLAIKTRLLEDLTREQVTRLATNASLQELEEIYKAYRIITKGMQTIAITMTAKYQRDTLQSKTQFKECLIEQYYAQNKRLNKFEQEIDKQTRLRIGEYLDQRWEEHILEVRKLEAAARRQHERARISQEKVEALKKLVDEKNATMPQNSDRQHCPLGPVASQYIRDASIINMPRTESPNGTGLSKDVVMTDAPPPDNHGVHAAPSQTPLSSLLATASSEQPLTPQSAAEPVTTSSPARVKMPAPAYDVVLNAVSKAISETRRRSSIANTGAQPLKQLVNLKAPDRSCQIEPSEKKQAPKPDKENDLIINTDNSHQYHRGHEYDHNKPASPSVSPTTADTKARAKAFVGLDRYAQGLFARSPSSSSGGTPK